MSVDNEQFKVNPNDFKKDKSLNNIRGGMATISFVQQISTNQKCVQKQFRLKGGMDKKSFNTSIELFEKCNHPAIIKFIGFSEDAKYGNIYLEASKNGSLDQYIEQNSENLKEPLNDDTHKLILSYGIACAMEYLHSLNIVHRDLKCKHILLDSEFHPLLTDFDCATDINAPFDEEYEIHQTTCYTMAPEFLDDFIKFNRTKPIDVYSYSLILYTIWTGKVPYPNINNNLKIIEQVLKNYRPEFSSDSSPNSKIKELITKCWDQDPNKRPTFSDICNFLETDDIIPNVNKEIFGAYKDMLKSKRPI